MKTRTRHGHLGVSGAAAVEFALVLPILLLLLFSIIDIGRFIQAKNVIANVSREGGSLGSRHIEFSADAADLITMLQASGSPLDLAASGRIYIWTIKEGDEDSPNPWIDTDLSSNDGALGVSSTIGSGMAHLGLSQTLYDHLVFDSANQTADISQVTVVEVFYRYTPITPVRFVPGLADIEYTMSSKAIF